MKVVVVTVTALVAAGIVLVVMLTASTPPAAEPASPAALPAPTVGPHPGATPTTGSEVLAPPPTGPEASAAPDGQPSHPAPGTGLPPLQDDDPLMPAPLPASDSREGALVPDYPVSIAGPLPGSDILTSAISTEGPVMQLTLVAASSASVDDLRAHYRRLWTSLGLAEQPSDDRTATFSGAHESLTLSVADSGTGNRYTIYGVFRTE